MHNFENNLITNIISPVLLKEYFDNWQKLINIAQLFTKANFNIK